MPRDNRCVYMARVCFMFAVVTGCRDDVCRVFECYRGGRVVMDVFWRRLCVSVL